MNKIGIFFGTETGTTRLIAKKIQKRLGDDLADKPLNVNRVSIDDLLRYDSLILGTPSYGVGDIPGRSVGCIESNWEEFFASAGTPNFAGKRVAIFGLGAQERYAERFASSLIRIYDVFKSWGAEMVGSWSTEGYTFTHSNSIINGKFVGLVIDQRTQGIHTDARIDAWLSEITPELTAHIAESMAVA
jgi:flavodoxin I